MVTNPSSFNMAWPIFQHLTTANKINKSLALAKYHTSGTKLYIRAAFLEVISTKSKLCQEPRGQLHSGSASSDSDSRQTCPVKASSCRNICPIPNHTGATQAKLSTTTRAMSQTLRQKNHKQQGIYTFLPLKYTYILTQPPMIQKI